MFYHMNDQVTCPKCGSPCYGFEIDPIYKVCILCVDPSAPVPF